MPEDHSYPIPSNDPARSRIADVMKLRERRDDPFFAHAIASAARIFDAPVAFISLISDETQEFLGIQGVDMTETPRSWSMCAYTVAARTPTISPDTHDDPRFRTHPIVANPPHVRFSASAPVILADGFCLGTICAIDTVPHDPPVQAQIDQLTDLAAMVARFYEVPHVPDPAQLAELKSTASVAQDQFLALIGHELRTPLNGIVGLAQCIDATDEGQREILDAIDDSAHHLNQLITSILSFTELSSGDVQLAEARGDLADIVARSVGRFDKRFAIQGKSLRVDGDGTRPILCDPNLLELAVTCLIDNVCSHGGDSARVWIEPDGKGALRVVVHDDGPGIAEDRHNAIWRAFDVGEDVYTRESGGLGLGLPLTRRVVELHGGRLELQSADPGLDAVLTLPAWRCDPSMAAD